MLSGTDLMREALTVTESFSGTFDVLVNAHAGQIEGTVTDKTSMPVAGVQVTLAPTQFRPRRKLYRTAITDANRRFAIASVTPGEYKAFAWEELEPFLELVFLPFSIVTGVSARVCERRLAATRARSRETERGK